MRVRILLVLSAVLATAIAARGAFPPPSERGGVAAEQVMSLSTGEGWPTLIAFSPDGRRLAAGVSAKEGGNRVRVWESGTGELVGESGKHQGMISDIGFSPDGHLLVSAAAEWSISVGDRIFPRPSTRIEFKRWGGEMLFWDLRDRGHPTERRVPANLVSDIDFSPDGREVASGGSDGLVRLWDADTGQLVATLDGHGGAISDVRFSPDGKLIASASVSGEEEGQLFTADGKRVASEPGDRTVRLWEVATRTVIAKLGEHQGGVYQIAFSPDGRILASACREKKRVGLKILLGAAAGAGNREDGVVRLWEVTSGKRTQILTRNDSGVTSMAFSPNGQYLVVGSDAGVLRIWEVATGKVIAVFQGHKREVGSVAYSPDGSLVASYCPQDGTLRIWDGVGNGAGMVMKGLGGSTGMLAFSPDGRFLAAGCADDRSVRVWHVMRTAN